MTSEPVPQALGAAEPAHSGVFKPWHFCVVAGLLAVGLRLAILPLIPIPVPKVHDEFSYLLGADTFASGGITNPQHPMWVHFETFHVNQQPTYCSMYPPAQALFLAFGQRILGHPWFGVCLSVAIMFAAICWMLQGWVPLTTSLLATLLAILGWGLTGSWINSYWGGAVAAGGGALVLGALPRLVRAPSAAVAALSASGLVILANSRPYEGFLTACAAAGVLAWWMHREKRPRGWLLRRRTAIPFIAITASAAVAMGYYNHRTTGDVFLHPYLLYQKTYASAQTFYVLPPVPAPAYRHENLRRYWLEWIQPAYFAAKAQPLSAAERLGRAMGYFFLNPFGLAIAAGLTLVRRWELSAVLLIAAAPAAGLMISSGIQPHYMAPVFGAFLIIGAAFLERVGRWQIGGPVLLAGLIGLSLAWCTLFIKLEATRAQRAPDGIAMRAVLIEHLERAPGQHLVIVEYSAGHDIHEEWVYNRADIDGAKIVWAQDMGEARNKELLDYYRGRRVWLLQPDIHPIELREQLSR